MRRLAAQEASASFDLEAGPLIRGKLLQLDDDEHELLITMHHIVSDGWSMGILANELSAFYSALLQGDIDPLSPLRVQYADYAVWQRKWIEGDVLQQQSEYWKTVLTGAPALLELPMDHPRPAQKDYAGASAGLFLDEKLTAGLKELSRRHGATLYMTLAHRLGGAAGKAVRSAGRGHRHPGGQPQPGRDRRLNRFLRQHTGPAHRPIRIANSCGTAGTG